MAAALTLFISDVQVEIEIAAALDDVRAALEAAWAPCRSPLLAPVRTERFEAVALGSGYAVRGGGTAREVALREDVLPVLEAVIYEAIPGWHRERVLLHAACVQRGGAALLLIGRSGAGKSSLALEALRRGFVYFSDELSVTDGERLWGIPRAVQFEPTDGERALPPWLTGVSVQRYRLRLAGGQLGGLPLFVPAKEQVACAPVAALTARVVAIERAEVSGLVAMPALEALAALHEAAFRPPRLGLGKLLADGRAAHLRWHEPGAGLEALEAWLDATA
jgi:hypothetical protein